MWNCCSALALREEEAFAVLMQRHGPLVWHVCRHVLSHDQDAEEAFQATFLVLIAKARSIRNQRALPGWLHRTAYRVALRAKRDLAIRRRHERRGQTMGQSKSLPESVLREALALLDEEVARLPERQRAVFVLCSLEGRSLAEAALELGMEERNGVRDVGAGTSTVAPPADEAGHYLVEHTDRGCACYAKKLGRLTHQPG